MRKTKEVTDADVGTITIYYTECDNPKCSERKNADNGPYSKPFEAEWYTVHYQGTLWDGGPYVEEMHFHAPECMAEWAKDRRQKMVDREAVWRQQVEESGIAVQFNEMGIYR